MNTLRRILPTAAWLLAAPFAQAGDGVLSAEPAERTELGLPGGWTAGAASIRADIGAAPRPERSGGGRESDVYGGYRGVSGNLGYSALVHYYSYPDARPEGGLGRYDHADLSTGVSWHALYARYDYTFSRDYLGIADARGTSYLDVGANHPLGRSTFLNLHAGDGRVAGPGNALWDWRDLRAGFTHKLDDGWMMVLNYRRVFGNGLLAERYGGMPRADSREPGIGRGHRGIVLSFKRGF